MAEIINLNKRRKAKHRLLKERQAAENRIKFGRTTKERQVAKLEQDRDERCLNGNKLDEKEEEQE